MTSTWTVTHQLERRWLRWRVHSVYNLISLSSSFAFYLDSPHRYWTKESARRELMILESIALRGQPRLSQEYHRQVG